MVRHQLLTLTTGNVWERHQARSGSENWHWSRVLENRAEVEVGIVMAVPAKSRDDGATSYSYRGRDDFGRTHAISMAVHHDEVTASRRRA